MFAAADCRVIKSSRAQIKTARASLLNIKALMADFFFCQIQLLCLWLFALKYS